MKRAIVKILRFLVRTIESATANYYYLVIAWDFSGGINQGESTNRQDNWEYGGIISSNDL